MFKKNMPIKRTIQYAEKKAKMPRDQKLHNFIIKKRECRLIVKRELFGKTEGRVKGKEQAKICYLHSHLS